MLGGFNPPIFQPAWMGAEGLLRAGDVKTAAIEIIHAEVAVFSTEWFRCEVTRDRFSLQTSQESHYEPLRDLLCGIFTTLSHTPTRMCGVNHSQVLQFPDRNSFDAFGWYLVPPDRWTDVLERPGVARLDEQGVRPDGREGWVRVRVEPVLDGTFRVVTEVNDHFTFTTAKPLADEPEATGRMVATLLEDWGPIAERAAKVFDRVDAMILASTQ